MVARGRRAGASPLPRPGSRCRPVRVAAS